MKNHLLIYFKIGCSLVIFLAGCKTFVKSPLASQYKALPPKAEVIVLYEEDSVPANSVYLAKNNRKLSSNDFNQIIYYGKQHAKKLGGNILKIRKVTDLNSIVQPHYELDFEIYYNSNLVDFSAYRNKREDSLRLLKFGPNPNYALLYIYPRDNAGIVIPYMLRMNNENLCEVKNTRKYEIKLTQEGLKTIVAATALEKTSVQLNVKFGEEYYLRYGTDISSINWTLIFWRIPYLNLTDKHQGELEYKKVLPNKESKP